MKITVRASGTYGSISRSHDGVPADAQYDANPTSRIVRLCDLRDEATAEYRDVFGNLSHRSEDHVTVDITLDEASA